MIDTTKLDSITYFEGISNEITIFEGVVLSKERIKILLKEVIEEDKDTLFSHLSSKLFVLRRRKGEKEVEWYARIKLVPKEYKDMFDSDAEYIIEFDESNFDPMIGR